MNKKFIDTRIATVELKEEGIIYVNHKSIDKFPVFDEIKELVDKILIIAEGNRYIFISDFRDMFQNWSTESKDYVTKHKELNELMICQVIIVNTLPIKLLINIFLSFNKPPNPTKVVDTYEKAVEWARKIEKI